MSKDASFEFLAGKDDGELSRNQSSSSETSSIQLLINETTETPKKIRVRAGDKCIAPAKSRPKHRKNINSPALTDSFSPESIEWSDEVYTVEQLVEFCSGQNALIVRVTQGYLKEPVIDLAKGQLLLVHGYGKEMRIIAQDKSKRKLSIPMNFPMKISIPQTNEVCDIDVVVKEKRTLPLKVHVVGLSDQVSSEDNLTGQDLELTSFGMSSYVSASTISKGWIDQTDVIVIPEFTNSEYQIGLRMRNANDQEWQEYQGMFTRCVRHLNITLTGFNGILFDDARDVVSPTEFLKAPPPMICNIFEAPISNNQKQLAQQQSTIGVGNVLPSTKLQNNNYENVQLQNNYVNVQLQKNSHSESRNCYENAAIILDESNLKPNEDQEFERVIQRSSQTTSSPVVKCKTSTIDAKKANGKFLQSVCQFETDDDPAISSNVEKNGGKTHMENGKLNDRNLVESEKKPWKNVYKPPVVKVNNHGKNKGNFADNPSMVIDVGSTSDHDCLDEGYQTKFSSVSSQPVQTFEYRETDSEDELFHRNDKMNGMLNNMRNVDEIVVKLKPSPEQNRPPKTKFSNLMKKFESGSGCESDDSETAKMDDSVFTNRTELPLSKVNGSPFPLKQNVNNKPQVRPKSSSAFSTSGQTTPQPLPEGSAPKSVKTAQPSQSGLMSPAQRTKPAPFSKPSKVPESTCRLKTTEDIPSDLRSLSVADVSQCLRLIGLEPLVGAFESNSVDGKQLSDMDDKDFSKRFHMTQFDASKLARFVRGWRP